MIETTISLGKKVYIRPLKTNGVVIGKALIDHNKAKEGQLLVTFDKKIGTNLVPCHQYFDEDELELIGGRVEK